MSIVKPSMHEFIIMSWDREIGGGLSLERFTNNQHPITIHGSWLWELVKNEPNADRTCYYLGRDESGRIEVAIHLHLFEKLRYNQMFVMNCNHLRRVRRGEMAKDLLTNLVFPYKFFDNDLDRIKSWQSPHLSNKQKRTLWESNLSFRITPGLCSGLKIWTRQRLLKVKIFGLPMNRFTTDRLSKSAWQFLRWKPRLILG